MKKTIIRLIILIMVSLTLSACQTPGYTEERKEQITKEHAYEAKRWFRINLPEAEVKSVEAYVEGIDLVAVIEGMYEYRGEEYKYMYDYHNGNMYLGYEYKSAEKIAADALREYFGENVKAIVLYPARFYFLTECENDDSRGYASEKGASIRCSGKVLPPGSDPLKYADFMLFGSNGDMSSSRATMYVDVIPEYDADTLEAFMGVDHFYFIKPINLEFDGLYYVSYSFDNAFYHYLKLVKISDGLYGGYSYTETIKYDESGEEISHGGVCDHPDEFIKDNGDGSYTITPSGAHIELLIFSEKQVKVSCTRRKNNGKKEKIDFCENVKYESELGNDYDLFYFDYNLPKSNYRLYSLLNSSGEYDITIKIE